MKMLHQCLYDLVFPTLWKIFSANKTEKHESNSILADNHEINVDIFLVKYVMS